MKMRKFFDDNKFRSHLKYNFCFCEIKKKKEKEETDKNVEKE